MTCTVGGMLTVKAYYKHFKSIYGALTAAISSIPLISALVPSEVSRYLFPPIGTGETFSKLATLILAGLVTLVIYFTKGAAFANSKKGRVEILAAILIAALLSLIIFTGLNLRFVRSIQTPDKGEFIFTVGYERSQAAEEKFKGKSDWDMLRLKGLAEEEVFNLWTPTSVIISRLTLLTFYLAFFLSAVAIGSLAVLFDKCGDPPNP